MAALITNIAKGRFARYADLPETADAMIWVLFSGTETDANIRDTDTLTSMIALAVDEATFTGYSRQTATGVTVTVDDTNDRVDVDVTTDPSWSPTTAQALTRIALVYDNDTGTGTDANIVPVFVDDFAITTPTSGSITYQVASGGFGRAS
jgi:hypothetical protein